MIETYLEDEGDGDDGDDDEVGGGGDGVTIVSVRACMSPQTCLNHTRAHSISNT